MATFSAVKMWPVYNLGKLIYVQQSIILTLQNDFGNMDSLLGDSLVSCG